MVKWWLLFGVMVCSILKLREKGGARSCFSKLIEEKRKFFNEFSSNVEKFRKILLCQARRCSWNTFKMAAGSLFDYVEAVERVVVENKFFRIFKSIMLVLFVLVVVLFKVHFNAVTGILPRIKELLILGVIGGSGYELLIFMNFRVTFTRIDGQCKEFVLLDRRSVNEGEQEGTLLHR